jgi:hypothetical protein
VNDRDDMPATGELLRRCREYVVAHFDPEQHREEECWEDTLAHVLGGRRADGTGGRAVQFTPEQRDRLIAAAIEIVQVAQRDPWERLALTAIREARLGEGHSLPVTEDEALDRVCRLVRFYLLNMGGGLWDSTTDVLLLHEDDDLDDDERESFDE